MPKSTGGLPLTHEACLPSPGRYTASQTLYQNRLPRFYGDLWGVLICLQHPGRRASLVFRPMLLRGGWSLSAGFIPAFTGFCISISLSVLWRAGASHGVLGITLLASAIHGLPFFLPRSQRRLLLTCGVRMARGNKKAAKVMHPVRTPSGQRERAHALAAYLSVLTPTGASIGQSSAWCKWAGVKKPAEAGISPA